MLESSQQGNAPCQVTHCLSIDVESFYEGMIESFRLPERFANPRLQSHEISVNLESVLTLLEQLGLKATFFFIGRIAEEQPQLVKSVAAHGHEIASHGFSHRRIYLQSPEEFRGDLRRSKQALEQAAETPVLGFRAPDFSITAESLWALDIIREEGFRYDASLTPTDIHDVYGMPGAERYLHRLPNGLTEFPPSTFSFLSRAVPFGGGGYLRLYPVWFTRKMIKSYESRGQSCMVYMHPYELGPMLPRIKRIPLLRRLRHYYNASRGGRRLRRTVAGFRFATVLEVIREKGFA